MATSFPFDGKIIKIPGAYSNIKSGVRNPPNALPFGNLLIIDTGEMGAGYGGGSGVDGELLQGKDSIVVFDNMDDFRNYWKGGMYWLLGQPLFRPGGDFNLAVKGVSNIFVIRAATTTAAQLTYTFDNDDSDSSNDAGYVTIKTLDEGVIGNGALNTNNVLKSGYGAIMKAGRINTAKFMIEFYLGTYKGLDQNTLPYDGISEIDATPGLVCRSVEFDNIQDLIDWCNTDVLFKKYFVLADSALVGSGDVTSADLAANATLALFDSATETFAATQLIDDALEAAADLNIQFVMSDAFGSNVLSARNTKILDFCLTKNKFKPELYLGGYNDVNGWASSIAAAEYWNNDSVSLVHGGIKKITQEGLRTYDVMYKTSAVLGREAGVEPQIPLTFKNIAIDAEVHQLNDREAEAGLDAGVLMTRLDDGSFDIIKGINTLRNNRYLINADSTTSSKQIKRIARNLNNEIRIDMKRDLLKDPNGVNRNTLAPIDLEIWLKAKLTSKKALPGADNLILSFRDITVTRNQDGYFVSYKFVVNSEISFLFATGTIVDL